MAVRAASGGVMPGEGDTVEFTNSSALWGGLAIAARRPCHRADQRQEAPPLFVEANPPALIGAQEEA